MKPPLQRIEEFLEAEDFFPLPDGDPTAKRVEKLECALRFAVTSTVENMRGDDADLAIKHIADILDGDGE